MAEKETAPAKDDFAGAFDAAANAKGGKPQTEDPLKAGQAEQPPAEPPKEPAPEKEQAVSEEPPAEEEKTPDPYEGLSPEVVDRLKAVEAERDKWRHRVQSDDGRVGALQKKINQLQATIDKYSQPAERPTMEQVTAAMGSDTGWAEFTEEYPEVAQAIDARLSAGLSTVKHEFSAQLQPLVDRAAEVQDQEIESFLKTDYPGWKGVVNTPEFIDWSEKQARGVRALMESDDPDDAAALFDLYKVHVGEWPGKPDPQDEPEDPRVKQLQQRRERQLQDGTTIPNRGAGVTPGPATDDFTAAFEHHAERLARQRAGMH